MVRHHYSIAPSVKLPCNKGQWAQAETAFRNALKQRPDVHDFAWLADVLDK